IETTPAASVRGGRLTDPGEGLDQLTASFKLLPALNFGCLEAGMLIFSPVRGLRPSEAARLATVKVPNPTSLTSDPFLSDAVIASKTSSTAFVASIFDRPVFVETTPTSSFLFTLSPPSYVTTKKPSMSLKMFGERSGSLERARAPRQLPPGVFR